MNDIRNITIGILSIVIVILGYSTRVTPATTPSVVGSMSSPDIMSPYLTFGGVRHWAGHTASLGQATTTVCALQSPNATSTLVHGSVEFDVSSTTATTITLAKGLTAYATTTPFNILPVAANAQISIVATSTNAVDGTVGIGTFAPNTWMVVGMQGGISAGTFSPSGECNAEWIEL